MPTTLALPLTLSVALAGAASSAPAPGDAPAAAPVPLLSAQASVPAVPGRAEGRSPPARLMRDGEAVVSPASVFSVEAGAPIADARLVLYDGQESLVEAEGSSEIGAAQSRFTLAPRKALRPGSRYVLRLEGAQSRELHDLGGRTYRPLSFPLLVAGQAPADPPPRKAKKKRRR